MGGHIRTWKSFNELKISDNTTFDVLGYKTKADYEKKNFEIIDNEIPKKVTAITLALDSIDSKDYEVVEIKNDKNELIKTYPEVK